MIGPQSWWWALHLVFVFVFDGGDELLKHEQNLDQGYSDFPFGGLSTSIFGGEPFLFWMMFVKETCLEPCRLEF